MNLTKLFRSHSLAAAAVASLASGTIIAMLPSQGIEAMAEATVPSQPNEARSPTLFVGAAATVAPAAVRPAVDAAAPVHVLADGGATVAPAETNVKAPPAPTADAALGPSCAALPGACVASDDGPSVPPALARPRQGASKYLAPPKPKPREPWDDVNPCDVRDPMCSTKSWVAVDSYASTTALLYAIGGLAHSTHPIETGAPGPAGTFEIKPGAVALKQRF